MYDCINGNVQYIRILLKVKWHLERSGHIVKDMRLTSLYISRQIPTNSITGKVLKGIAGQADQSCENVGAILAAAGSDYDKAFKITCFYRIWKLLRPLIMFTLNIYVQACWKLCRR